MPVYNGEKYIKQAVDSVFVQEVPLELLVIDD
ncbi:MAG: glycosyltransferase family 2 protein, partial [Eubacteriales bacterium]|nr:glycosyltransferase family 2 protein [Eubacteriales bacterium]